MPHIERDWSEITIKENGEFLRRFWLNQDAPINSVWGVLMRYSGDVEIDIAFHDKKRKCFIYDTDKGREGKFISDDGNETTSLLLFGEWWSYLSPEHAISPARNQIVKWVDGEWVIDNI